MSKRKNKNKDQVANLEAAPSVENLMLPPDFDPAAEGAAMSVTHFVGETPFELEFNSDLEGKSDNLDDKVQEMSEAIGEAIGKSIASCAGEQSEFNRRNYSESGIIRLHLAHIYAQQEKLMELLENKGNEVISAIEKVNLNVNLQPVINSTDVKKDLMLQLSEEVNRCKEEGNIACFEELNRILTIMVNLKLQLSHFNTNAAQEMKIVKRIKRAVFDDA
jgi:hypothetical protein